MNSKEKRRLRRWMLSEYGDGETAPCSFCDKPLTLEDVTIDHWPVPACLGGQIIKGNIRPTCGPCNNEDSERIERQYGFLTPRERIWEHRRLLQVHGLLRTA